MTNSVYGLWRGFWPAFLKFFSRISTAHFPRTPATSAPPCSDGFVQITMRGAACWCSTMSTSPSGERGKGSTNENPRDGSKVTILFRDPALREKGHPAGRRRRPLLWRRVAAQVGRDARQNLGQGGPTREGLPRPGAQGRRGAGQDRAAEDLGGKALALT